jgi:ComF family protein
VIDLISETIKEIIFPKYCVSCRRAGSLLCQDCWPKISFIYEQICPICRQPSIAGRTHTGCATKWGIDGLISLTYYSGPIRGLIRQLKYRGATVTQELISRLLFEYVRHESIYLPPAIITPIPLHPHNLRRRGFNQAEIIATALSMQLSYPQVVDVVQRQRQTVSQTTLAKQQRQQNMRGAFRVSDGQQIKGADFILVDDVFTTGATLREATKTLKRAGASSVFGFTLARD